MFRGGIIIELTKDLILGFTVGISAAVIPGPMMFATIGASFHKGWRAGPSVFIGHALVELAFFVLILVGASSFLGKSVVSYLAIIGGLMMVVFGLVMIKKAKEASTMDVSISASSLNLSSGPVSSGIMTSALNPFSGTVSAGIITSALNPFFVAWWLTAGSAILLQEYLAGIFAVTAFIVGHWIADLGFLVAVSSSFSRGTEVISQSTHKKLVYLCGGFMAFFGLWFMINNNNILR
ncbi:LysE family transporter [Methanosarcina sp.]|uniref:LysE family transporter n=1 Tax=Methanosarcina sp. TaxID=2213 RepID=UPI002AB92ECE|nr:LysE family transporter [Methanosarcina sp.]MDY9927562.1 LysE family transporter [Methanosarcina sp.]